MFLVTSKKKSTKITFGCQQSIREVWNVDFFAVFCVISKQETSAKSNTKLSCGGLCFNLQVGDSVSYFKLSLSFQKFMPKNYKRQTQGMNTIGSCFGFYLGPFDLLDSKSIICTYLWFFNTYIGSEPKLLGPGTC